MDISVAELEGIDMSLDTEPHDHSTLLEKLEDFARRATELIAYTIMLAMALTIIAVMVSTLMLWGGLLLLEQIVIHTM